jgi:hypothetical protein
VTRLHSVILALSTGACGGATAALGDDGGASGEAEAVAMDGGADGADADARTIDGPAGDGGEDCEAMAAEVSQLQSLAQQCCPACKSLQCGVGVQGVCCPVTANDLQAAKVFEAAAQHYIAVCHPVCPPVDCAAAPNHVCLSSGHCA